MRTGCIFLFLLWISSALSAQTRIKGATGRWEVVGDVSMAEAEERALWEAKKAALQKAGIEYEISYSFTSLQQVDQERYLSVYNKLSRTEIAGRVRVKRKKTEKIYDEKNDRFWVAVTIDALVEKQERRDAEFRLDIDGLHRTYRAGEVLNFNCRTYKDCYLRIFIFDDKGGSLVYPNRYENDRLYQAGEIYPIPPYGQAVYELTKTGDSPCEYNLILVVATKKKIPFFGKTEYEQVLKWLCDIPLKERTEEWRSFLVE